MKNLFKYQIYILTKNKQNKEIKMTKEIVIHYMKENKLLNYKQLYNYNIIILT